VITIPTITTSKKIISGVGKPLSVPGASEPGGGVVLNCESVSLAQAAIILAKSF